MKLIAVEGCKLTTPGGTVSIVSSVTNPNISVDNKKVYHSITFTVVVGDYTGGGTLNSSTVNSTGDNVGFICLGDNITVPTSASWGRTGSATVTVTDAGQTSTYAD